MNQPAPSAEEIKEALQFLDNGMRGYYAHLESSAAIIATGDSVMIED